MNSSSSNETRWAGPRTQVRLWSPVRGVVVHSVVGHFTLDAAKVVMEGIAKVWGEKAPVSAFNDWLGMDGYDSEARIALTDFVFASRRQFDSIHILLRSKLVSMGVSVADLALGGMIQAYTEPQPWKEALYAASRPSRSASASGASFAAVGGRGRRW
jgi:hypothetical protein